MGQTDSIEIEMAYPSRSWKKIEDRQNISQSEVEVKNNRVK